MAPHCYLSCVQPFPFMWFCAFCNSVCYKKFARYRSESVDTAEVVMWWHFRPELEFYSACTESHKFVLDCLQHLEAKVWTQLR